ncbi:hypothetical protein ACR79B_12540 [Sphingobacterium spiritivorum]|uniref:hypothetical protein n=1 Tax=Sphingobacterium spiritivorum TaxID=258 RepID=UPI003DA45097
MKFKLFLSLFLCLFFSTAFAQHKKFKFIDELCEYEGTYDSKKYTEQQLKDTYNLYYGESWLLSAADHRHRSKPTEQVLSELKTEYQTKRAKLKGFQLVKNPVFISFRDSLILSMDQEYLAKSALVKALKDPKALLEYKAPDSCAINYTKPLVEGGEALLKAYEVLTKYQMKNNGDPQRLYNIYLENIQSSKKYESAFKEVLIYGWWNCVNHFIPRPTYDARFSENYHKLFIKVDTLDCDEP